MAIDCHKRLWPSSVSEPKHDIKDMDVSKYKEYQKDLEIQKVMMGSGCKRIKVNIKRIQQDHCSNINKGTKSGSGNIVQNQLRSADRYGVYQHLSQHYLLILTEI